jgi:hypothetical protein
MECRKRFFVMNPAKFGMIIQMYAILEHGDWNTELEFIRRRAQKEKMYKSAAGQTELKFWFHNSN